MDKITTKKISAIVRTESELEDVILQLFDDSVARSDISIQGSPEQIKQRYGDCFIDPKFIQKSKEPPTQEPFLEEDFGWVVGLSFAIPLVICMIVAIFLIGDVRSYSDNWFYGITGIIVGSAVGFLIARTVKKKHDDKIIKQEKEGGFVLWINTHSAKQHQQVLKILKNHHALHIKAA